MQKLKMAGEALQIAVERREVKSKEEKENWSFNHFILHSSLFLFWITVLDFFHLQGRIARGKKGGG